MLQALNERIDALEIRLAFQDETIETLNQTITAQWKQIDALTRQMAELNGASAGSREPGARPRQTNLRRITRRSTRTSGDARSAQQQSEWADRGRVHILNQITAMTTATTIAAHTTGVTCFVLPLRGEALAA